MKDLMQFYVVSHPEQWLYCASVSVDADPVGKPVR